MPAVRCGRRQPSAGKAVRRCEHFPPRTRPLQHLQPDDTGSSVRRQRTAPVVEASSTVSGEALLLALSSIVRPTTLAAVFAMVSRPGGHRYLVAYLVTGLAFSVGVGVVVVLVLRGYAATLMSTSGRAVLDIALGAGACGYAIGVGTRRWSENAGKPGRTTTWLRHRLDNLTAFRAALVGVVTHLPGLVYLAALNAIVSAATSPVHAVAQVVVYN